MVLCRAFTLRDQHRGLCAWLRRCARCIARALCVACVAAWLPPLSLLASQRASQARVPALPARLARVRQRLDEDPATLADLSILSREAGLSRFQLIRAFRRYTGLTPHAYRMQSRANLCRRLLMQGLPPAEVAAVCGYVDQSHMHREFRRRFGLTPGAYRSARLGCNPVQDEYV